MNLSAHLNCKTIDGNPDRHFTLNFVLSGNRWTQGEPGGTSDVFKTKNGTFVVVVNTTSLKTPAGGVVAVLRNFNPGTTVEGTRGNDGRVDETGRIFEWAVETVVK